MPGTRQSRSHFEHRNDVRVPFSLSSGAEKSKVKEGTVLVQTGTIRRLEGDQGGQLICASQSKSFAICRADGASIRGG
ncbi:hypothetical protein NOVOSPHI9U_260142 [Novosphingobium sp. 9U]|nr:hypothetical protein NOVOSPHI9U_260142 [Novosphingobium sp. 9U]